MNRDNKSDALQPVYPQYINTYDQQDEISLVDLWIALLKFKKVYLWSFIFSIIVGITAVTLLSTPRYEMTSLLEIANYHGEPIENPAAVISKINTFILPTEIKAVSKANNGLIFDTNVSNAKGTSLIKIKNKASENQVVLFSEFQSKVSARVINEHREMLFKLNLDVRKAIALEEALKPALLTREAYIKEFKPGVVANINQLEDRIKKQADSITNDQVANADLKTLEKMVLISQEVRGLIAQKITLEQELSTSYDLYNTKVKESERKILELKNNIETGLTRVVTQSELSPKPVSRPKSLLYSIVIVLSLFLAFAFTLVVMFRAKVIERMADEA